MSLNTSNTSSEKVQENVEEPIRPTIDDVFQEFITSDTLDKLSSGDNLIVNNILRDAFEKQKLITVKDYKATKSVIDLSVELEHVGGRKTKLCIVQIEKRIGKEYRTLFLQYKLERNNNDSSDVTTTPLKWVTETVLHKVIDTIITSTPVERISINYPEDMNMIPVTETFEGVLRSLKKERISEIRVNMQDEDDDEEDDYFMDSDDFVTYINRTIYKVVEYVIIKQDRLNVNPLWTNEY
jgi:hypothetical protein